MVPGLGVAQERRLSMHHRPLQQEQGEWRGDHHRDAQQRYGAAGARYFGYLSDHTWSAFHANLGTEFSAFYLLWVGFGVYAAWRIVGPPRTA